ncbi:MAG: TonB-dependent receptor [Proteobacteria bacterium]|nr:TonB-dependent receptor [Pseudomonadota bacterium]
MYLNRKHLLCTTVIAGLAGVAWSSAAFAQDKGGTPPASPSASSPAPATQPAPQDNTDVSELVVTGSRIKRSEFNTASPIQVVSPEAAVARGVTDTVDLLQSSPLASGSPQVNSTISTAFVTDGGPGAATISLRGLGANRTLVLLNGRRAGPAGTRGSVSAFDLNVLPESAIDHIEILKDGASSVYGSDAIAGVVNIITKKNNDGFDFHAFGSNPQHSGGAEYEVNGSWGKTFDKGYFNVSVDYFEQMELRVGDRNFTNCAEQYIFNSSGGRADAIDARTGKPACLSTTWGQIYVYGFNGAPQSYRLQYDASGQLGVLVPGTLINGPGGNAYGNANPSLGPLGVPNNWFRVGGPATSATAGVSNAESPQELASSVIPDTKRLTVYSQFGYDLTPHTDVYAEVLLNRRTTKDHGFRQFWTYTYGEDAGDPFSAGFTGNYFYSPTAITDHFSHKTEVNYARVVAGLKGDFSGFDALHGWTWDLFAQYSHSDGAYTQDVILKDAVYASDGRSDFGSFGLFNANSIPRPTASCVGYTTPVSHRACIDIPWMDPNFLAGNLTPEQKAFLYDTETGRTIYTQTYVEGTMTGDLFHLPAGPVGAAIGFHIRHDSINDVPGAITLAHNSWGLTGAGITKGTDNTREVFGEFQVPLLKGYPLIEQLSASISGRYTHVDSYGGNGTYKVGLNWQTTPWLRLRASYGTSFRAPGLFELYLADQTSFLGQRSVDPCINYAAGLAAGTTPQRVATNCAAAGVAPDFGGAQSSAEVVSGGGKGFVKAETSKALTAGVILTPSFADLSIALDYFDIDISNEITQLGANNIPFLCYNSLTFPTDPLCTLFTRPTATSGITVVHDNYLNIATQKNRGLDLTVRYRRDIPWGAKLTLDGQFTWQLEDKQALFANNVVDSNGQVGDPDFTGLANVRIDKGDWSATWSVDMIGKASSAEQLGFDTNASGTIHYKVHTEFVAFHSISVKKKFDTWSMTLGISNLFDRDPPSVTTLNLGAFNTVGRSVLASQYQEGYYGRRFFIDVSKKF